MPTNPDEYARIAAAQRESLRSIADRIEKGEPLSHSWERGFAAAAIRAAASQIPDQAPKPRGHPPQFERSIVAFEYGGYVHGGLSKNKAIERLAQAHDVTVEAIKAALKKGDCGDAAIAWFQSASGVRVFLKGGKS